MGERPTVFGSESRFKSTLGRHVERGRALIGLGQSVGADLASATNSFDQALAEVAEERWAGDVERWRGNVLRSVWSALGRDGARVLPTVTVGWPPPSGKPRHARRLSWVEPWLRDSVYELEDLRGNLGVRRNVAVASPPLSTRFAELYASGLLEAAVIDGHVKGMQEPKTPRQLVTAIGEAKELAEATLRGALRRLNEPYRETDNLGMLMKKWRNRVELLAPPDPGGARALDKAQAALGNVVVFLDEWRNAYGSGHGRPRFPPRLKSRHARLAIDSAEAAIRFVVTTMDDLELLAP